MENERYKMAVTVGLLLLENNKILLARRYQTGYKDGKYGLIAGHLEKGESLKETIVREVREETGIRIQEKELQYVCCLNRSQQDYMSFYLSASSYDGIPEIQEKDKCDKMKWFLLDDLPDNMVEEDRKAIQNYQEGIQFQYHKEEGSMS